MNTNSNGEWEAREKLQDVLMQDEDIQWAGKPDPSIHFSKADAWLVPFSIFWFGFTIFWEAIALGVVTDIKERPPIEFALFGIPFVLFGLYLVIGRFIYKAWRKHRTYYAVTNKRVFILTEIRNKNLQAVYLCSIPALYKSVRSDGVGTVVFGNMGYMAAIYANSGLDFFGSFYGPLPPVFYDIRRADEVYELVNRLRLCDKNQ